MAAAQPPVDLEHKYPAGSIATAAAAEQALKDADAAQRATESRYNSEKARCAHVVLVTECQDNARRARTLGQNQVHRVQTEAHDLQRKLAAQQRAARRDEQQEQSQREEQARPDKERAAHQAAQQREGQVEVRAQEAGRQQAEAPTNRKKYEERNAQHDREVAHNSSVQLRNSADNARHYQEKQDKAKAYAATRAREREQSEKERAERERKRKAQMAQSTPEAAPATDPPSATTPKDANR